MRSNSQTPVLVLVLCISALLSPGLLSAVVWTPINLIAALVGVGLSVLASVFVQRWRWAIGILTAASVAVPPYPNWIYWTDSRGWFFWLGPTLEDGGLVARSLLMLPAIGLVYGLFWAIDRLRRSEPEPS